MEIARFPEGRLLFDKNISLHDAWKSNIGVRIFINLLSARSLAWNQLVKCPLRFNNCYDLYIDSPYNTHFLAHKKPSKKYFGRIERYPNMEIVRVDSKNGKWFIHVVTKTKKYLSTSSFLELTEELYGTHYWLINHGK